MKSWIGSLFEAKSNTNQNAGHYKLDEDFYQSKYEYFRIYNLWVLAVACLVSVIYFFVDCYLVGCWTTVTLPQRLLPVMILLAYCFLQARTDNHKIMVCATFIVAHFCALCAVWANSMMGRLDYSLVAFLISNILFLCIGITSPFRWAIVGNLLLFVDFIIGYFFTEPKQILILFMIGLPLYFGILIFCKVMENT